jgi:putative ABC transport system permease protein
MRLIPWDYGVRNLARSPARLWLSVAGSALVVLLVLAAAAFVRGMEGAIVATGGERNVILLGAGSEESVERSEISPTVPDQAAASLRGVKSRLGVAYVSPEVYLDATVRAERDAAESAQASVRGVTPAAFLVHGQVRVAEGRVPEPGRDEVLAGSAAASKLGLPADRLAVGRTLWFDDRQWTVVGRFDAPGTVLEAELWAPLTDLQLAAKRENLSCVILTLDGAAELDDADVFAKRRTDLELVAIAERDYYGRLGAFFRPIQAMVWATAGLIAVGGLLGGLNTMYAAFAGRVRELGTLQALGFSRRAIVLSLVQESVLATAAGSLLAVLAGLLLVNGQQVRFSMGVFGLVVDSGVVLLALAAGLALGVVGALPPAVRCLRLPITAALKAV